MHHTRNAERRHHTTIRNETLSVHVLGVDLDLFEGPSSTNERKHNRHLNRKHPRTPPKRTDEWDLPLIRSSSTRRRHDRTLLREAFTPEPTYEWVQTADCSRCRSRRTWCFHPQQWQQQPIEADAPIPTDLADWERELLGYTDKTHLKPDLVYNSRSENYGVSIYAQRAVMKIEPLVASDVPLNRIADEHIRIINASRRSRAPLPRRITDRSAHRVWDAARILGCTPSALITQLRAHGHYVKNAHSTVPAHIIADLRRQTVKA